MWPEPGGTLHHLAAHQIGMPMRSRKLGHDRPHVVIRHFECITQRLDGRGTTRRTVHQGYHGRVTAVVEHFVQTDLQ